MDVGVWWSSASLSWQSLSFSTWELMTSASWTTSWRKQPSTIPSIISLIHSWTLSLSKKASPAGKLFLCQAFWTKNPRKIRHVIACQRKDLCAMREDLRSLLTHRPQSKIRCGYFYPCRLHLTDGFLSAVRIPPLSSGEVRWGLNNGRFASSDLPSPLALAIRGHLVMVILVKIDFGNAVICSLYINILIFIYSADYDIVCFFDFDKWPNDQMTAAPRFFVQ